MTEGDNASATVQLQERLGRIYRPVHLCYGVPIEKEW